NCPLGFGGCCCRKFGAEALEGSLASIGPAVKIDNGMPEDSVEPGNHVLIGRRFLLGLKRFEEAVLDEVFGEMRIADTFPGKGDEHLEILQDRLLDVVHA